MDCRFEKGSWRDWSSDQIRGISDSAGLHIMFLDERCGKPILLVERLHCRPPRGPMAKTRECEKDICKAICEEAEQTRHMSRHDRRWRGSSFFDIAQ